jgi:hypothetical protein
VPKFIIEAEFSLYTDVDADIYGEIGDTDGVDNYENNSYFSAETVSLSGGNITFTVEAEDEADAERQAERVIADGHEVEDSNGLTWGVSDVSFSIEKNEMSREEAFVIVRRLLDRLVAESHITSEEREALDLVIQDA